MPSYTNICPKKVAIETLSSLCVINEESLYWENINQGNILQDMP